ncbi:hypothetical protein BS78_07G222900 [Paspalum vaginatum]|nr:hypothetical protein BS78_07G222900 [Paspalum vaginatum]
MDSSQEEGEKNGTGTRRAHLPSSPATPLLLSLFFTPAGGGTGRTDSRASGERRRLAEDGPAWAGGEGIGGFNAVRPGRRRGGRRQLGRPGARCPGARCAGRPRWAGLRERGRRRLCRVAEVYRAVRRRPRPACAPACLRGGTEVGSRRTRRGGGGRRGRAGRQRWGRGWLDQTAGFTEANGMHKKGMENFVSGHLGKFWILETKKELYF